MAKVEVPVVPVVRATSFDSMDSVRMAYIDSFNNSALDITSVKHTVWNAAKVHLPSVDQTVKTTNFASKSTTQPQSVLGSLLTSAQVQPYIA